jgi:hypothetical protein
MLRVSFGTSAPFSKKKRAPVSQVTVLVPPARRDSKRGASGTQSKSGFLKAGIDDMKSGECVGFYFRHY